MLEERNWNAMKIGFTELILVVIVAFVVIGPDKLPEYARKFGKMLRELKKVHRCRFGGDPEERGGAAE